LLRNIVKPESKRHMKDAPCDSDQQAKFDAAGRAGRLRASPRGMVAISTTHSVLASLCASSTLWATTKRCCQDGRAYYGRGTKSVKMRA